MRAIVIEAAREAYSAEEVKTMTVGELRHLLFDYDDDTTVILSHDNGYTYGGIHASEISEIDE